MKKEKPCGRGCLISSICNVTHRILLDFERSNTRFVRQKALGRVRTDIFKIFFFHLDALLFELPAHLLFCYEILLIAHMKLYTALRTTANTNVYIIRNKKTLRDLYARPRTAHNFTPGSLFSFAVYNDSFNNGKSLKRRVALEGCVAWHLLSILFVSRPATEPKFYLVVGISMMQTGL